ncbi:MAG: hypothetical protein NBV65_10385 [Burkholderiaceae bacterium]|nr:hypothetical protein [Burkholderiaceae bacterium]
MRRIALLWLALCGWPCAQAEPVRVSVLMHAASNAADVASAAGTADEAALRPALEQALAEQPAFIVVNGLKAASEPCRDRLFRQRKAVLEASPVPVFLSMAGRDWIACRDRQGRPAASIWLNLLREQLYGDISWNGSKQVALRRQSAIPAFRSYAENTRWAWRDVLFATLHLPADNNHFLPAAGNNSEFEDRLTANRDWIKRLAARAQAMRAGAVVIFSDGQVFAARVAAGSPRDGFAETRAALKALAEKAGVPVLLVQGSTPPAAAVIRRSGKLFTATLPQGVSLLVVDTDAPLPFAVQPAEAAAP